LRVILKLDSITAFYWDPMRNSARSLLLTLLGSSLIAAALGMSCTPDEAESKDFYHGEFAERPNVGGADSGLSLPCRPARAIKLPARAAVMSQDAGSTQKPMFTRDLFSSFQSHCGGCHVDTNQGGFDDQKVTFENFDELVDQDAVDFIKLDDP